MISHIVRTSRGDYYRAVNSLPRLLPLLVLTACSASLDVPLGAQITCATDGDCFNGQRCLLDIRLCVDAGQSCVIEVAGGFNSVGNGTTCTQRDGASGVCLGGQCLQSRCGDGYVDPSTAEQCDDGAANSDTKSNACRTDCIRGRCGDSILDDITEVCDDGNTASGDGCRADCKKLETCGDAVADAGENCDDANDNANDGCDRCQTTAWVATRMVGAGGFGGTTTDALLSSQGPVAVDLTGNIYFGDAPTCRILKIDPRTSSVTTVAGVGLCNLPGSVEGAIAHGTPIGTPRHLAVTTRGVLYFHDGVYIRSIDPQSGRLHNVIGNGAGCVSAGQCPDGGTASSISLGQVSGLEFDGQDNLYYSEANVHVVRIMPAGSTTVFVVMGQPFTAGSDFSDNGPGGDTLLNQPIALAVSSDGVVHVSDYGNNRILSLEVNDDRTHRVAGNGTLASSPDGSTAATSSIRFPGNNQDLELLRDGKLVFYELGKLRFVGTDGKLGTLGGTGTEGSTDGPALTSQLGARFYGGTRDSSLVFVEAFGSVTSPIKIRMIAGGALSTLLSSPPRQGLIIGQAATGTPLRSVRDVARTPNGDVFIAISSPPFIFRLAGGVGDLEPFAGEGTSSDENVLASEIELGTLNGLYAAANGDLIYADGGRHVIRKIDGVTRRVTTLVGTPGVVGAFAGDNGPALAARLNAPQDVDVAANGDMYIHDASNFRIRKVTASTGIITTIAGNGSACTDPAQPCGDGGQWFNASLSLSSGIQPQLLVAPNGDVVFTEPSLRRIRMVVAADGTVQRIAGVQTTGTCASPLPGSCGDGAAATAATFSSVGGIALDGSGLLVGDGRIRRLSALSTSATVSHAYLSGLGDTSRDSMPEAVAHGLAQIVQPAAGVIYFASSDVVRKIENGVVNTVAGLVAGFTDGPVVHAELGHPFAMSAIPNNRWVIADGLPSGKIRMLDATAMRVSTVAGRLGGLTDDVLPNHLAKYAALATEPSGIAYDGTRDTFYFSDHVTSVVRAVALGGGAPESWTISSLMAASWCAWAGRWTRCRDAP